MYVEDVTDENYESFTNCNQQQLVAYGIASCDPCQEYDPIARRNSRPAMNEVRIGKAKMHVPGRCREIKKRHNFETYPTTHLFSQWIAHLLSREGKIEAE